MKHDFHESERYDLLHGGERYPPKAILGISARRSAGRILQPSDFSGGESSACFRVLRSLGFTVSLKPEFQAGEGSDWSDEEIDASVSAYLTMLRDEISGKPYNKAEMNRQLRAESLRNRTKGSVEFRMQNISAVLRGLNRRWISGYKPAANVGSEVTSRIVASLERLDVFNGDDALPEADPVALKKKVNRNRILPLAHQPVGEKAPKRVTRSVEEFERDPMVKAWVLQTAHGKCELCACKAPFVDDDGLPFLEVHHVIPLADGGSDVVSNAVALCPNCHRRCHHATDRENATLKLKEVCEGRST